MNDSMNVHRLSDLLYSHFSGPSPTCIERNVRGNEWGVLKTTCSTTEGWNWRAHKVLPPAFWNLTRLEVKSGDSIITKAGPRHRVGVASFVDFVPPQIVPSGKMICLRPNPQRVLPGYLALALSDSRTQRYLDQRTTGMAESQVNFENNALLGAPVWLPERDEQERILEALTGPTAAVTSLERLIVKKQAIKHGMMQQLLTGRTRLPSFAGQWEVLSLGSVAKMGSGGTPPLSVERYYGGGIPWVSISDMTRAGKYLERTVTTLSAEGLSASAARLYEPNVVLYAMYASLGECSIAVGRVCSSQAILGIDAGPRLDREFLYYHLLSIKPRVKLLGQQGTQSNLNAGMVRSFELRLPPIDEQRAISAALADADIELRALERRLESTRLIKQGMMQELLTGRTRLVPAEVGA